MRNFARTFIERLAQRVAIGRVFTDTQPEPEPETAPEPETEEETP